jgi:hypothetical protein
MTNRTISQRKKNPSQGLGLEAYLLSHIKAPLREEKRGAASCPVRNLSNNYTAHKHFAHAPRRVPKRVKRSPKCCHQALQPSQVGCGLGFGASATQDFQEEPIT